MNNDYVSVTEITGDEVTQEQTDCAVAVTGQGNIASWRMLRKLYVDKARAWISPYLREF